jgi:hypothetical protein
MPHRRRILNHFRSNLIAYIALFFALSGTAAYAAGGLLVYSDNIVDGQVFSVDVADDNLTGIDVQNGSLTGSDIADFTVSSLDITNENLGGWDIANGTLTGADVADNSLTGDDIAENTLSLARMGCQSGKVLGFARVKGLNVIPLTYTSDPQYIDLINNCSGGPVLVRRTNIASWNPLHVKFVDNPAALAVATPNADGLPLQSSNYDNIITVAKEYSADEGWYFRVEIRDVCDAFDPCDPPYNHYEEGNFTMMLP